MEEESETPSDASPPPAPREEPVVAEAQRKRSAVLPAVIGGVGGIVITLVVVLIVVGIGGSSGSKKPAATPPASTTTTSVPLTPLEHDMLNLLTEGNGVNYHAVYSLSSPQTTAQHTTVTVELWRQPPDVRQNTTIVTGPSSSATDAFQIPSGLVQCDQANGGPWSCKPAVASDVGLAGPSTLVQRAASQLVGATVTEADQTVGGQPSRCFNITIATQLTVVCANSQGIPTMESSQGSQLVLTQLDYTIPAGTFTPPAAVVTT